MNRQGEERIASEEKDKEEPDEQVKTNSSAEEEGVRKSNLITYLITYTPQIQNPNYW